VTLNSIFRQIQEENDMDKNLLKSNWFQVRGYTKVWWGKITDEDIEKVGGEIDKLIGLIQEKYGYTTEQARDEYNLRMAEFEATQNSGDALAT
jgi:uncharacterized protein YjbJ (UPF0337 family)